MFLLFILKNLKNEIYFNVWVPNNWFLKSGILKNKKHFFLFNFFFINFKKLKIFYNKKNILKFYKSNIYLKCKNKFIKIFLNINYPFYIKNISIYNLKKNNNYFFYLYFYIFDIYNYNIKKVFLKTYTSDFFNLYFLKKSFLLKINNEINFNNFIEILNYININFIEKIFFFFKKIFFKDNLIFNIGPSLKFFFYFKNFNKKFIIYNLYLNEFIENKIIYYFMNIKFNNKKNVFFNIPVFFENFLKFNFYLNKDFLKIFYLKKIIKNNNLNFLFFNSNLLKYVNLKIYKKINIYFVYFFSKNFKKFFYKNLFIENKKKLNYFLFLKLININKKNFILFFLGKDYFNFFLFLIIFFFLFCFFFKIILNLIYV